MYLIICDLCFNTYVFVVFFSIVCNFLAVVFCNGNNMGARDFQVN